MKLLDLFSGIGGFHLGLEHAGFKFDWVGFSDIDSYANKQYKRRFPNAKKLGDITNVQYGDLPKDIDVLCGGFPCQAFSIAGKRKGFDDTRGTLFFEIARILRYFKRIGKPIPYFILENVKGLLNHEDGQTFATIYRVLTDLDYTIECQILNTRWFLPQNRERIYIVGHLGERGRSKIFPIGEAGKENKTCKERGITGTVKGGWGSLQNDATYLNQIGTIGKDSEATRVYDTTCARTIKNGGGMGAKTGLYQIKTHNLQQRNPNRPSKLQGQSGGSGALSKEDGTSYCLETHNLQAVEMEGSNIRRLTPKECERLQGFPDGWTEGQSDAQRYKQLGNAVSVPVVKAIGEKLIEIVKEK
jgi:DNA (cytosine-5)-methyltransferase 1